MARLRVRLETGSARSADVNSIVLPTGLQEEAFWFDIGKRQRLQKIRQHTNVDLDELLIVGPGGSPRVRAWLGIRVVENVIRRYSGVLQGQGNLFWRS